MKRPLFFGEPWPSGVCDDGVPVPVPVGEPCLFCDEPFEPRDRGWFFAGPNGSPVHRECGLRMVVGGVECLKRQHAGTHVIGDHDPDPPHMSKREGAQAAWAWVMEHGQ